MDIAQVCTRYYPTIGGAETYVREISERLAKKGFNIEVITTDPSWKLSNSTVFNDVKITRFKSIAPNDGFFFSPQIWYYMKKHNYDIVHVHSYHGLPALFAALAKKKQRLIFTPHYHGVAIRQLLNRVYRFLGGEIFERAEKIVCVSQFELNQIKRDFDISASKLVCIPNGINYEDFKEVKRVKKDSKTILFVGHLEKYKGVQYIIKALPKLDRINLEIIGKGPFEKELRILADDLDVNDRITWMNHVPRDELLVHYKSADVFVILSQLEAYGIVVAEALTSGTPSVVAKTSALSEFIDNRMCFGMNMPPSTNELAETILHAMSVEHSVYRGKSILDWDKVVDVLMRQAYEID